MEGENKDIQESMGDKGNGKEHENFCLLCSRYTKDALKPVQIGSITVNPKEVIAITADACPKCLVIINNAARNLREAVASFRKQQEEAMKKVAEAQKGSPLVDASGNRIGGEPGSKIAVPKLMLGKNFMKGIKGGKS